jgi:recombination protein RecA
VANAQKAGGIAAFIDAEHALDPEYAKKLGVDTDNLLVSQPDTGEQALEIADMLIRSGPRHHRHRLGRRPRAARRDRGRDG